MLKKFLKRLLPRESSLEPTRDATHPRPLHPTASSAPFSDIQVWIKQMGREGLTEQGAFTMLHAFPLFLSREGFSASPLRENEVVPGDGQERRFAGDTTLPRGRYYSVAKDEYGDDGGTLAAELDAYYDPQTVGPLRVMDVDLHTTGVAEQLKKEGHDLPEHGRALGVIFPAYEGGPHPLAARMGYQEAADLGILLAVEIKRVRFRRAIDLRVPTVADWFAREFSTLKFEPAPGVSMQAFPFLPPLKRFDKLIFTLLGQQLGGNKFTRIAGQWLREMGADALIYPSARCDCYVLAEGGRVKDFGGWNLVDYRDAPPKSTPVFLTNDDIGWPLTLVDSSGGGYLSYQSIYAYEHVRLGYVYEGPQTGSWQITGMKEKRREEVAEGLSLFKP